MIDYTQVPQSKVRQVAYNEGYQKGATDMEKAKQIIIDNLLKQLEQIREDYAHELKETFNSEIPSNYASTQPFFTLENVRMLVDEVLKEQK